MLGDEYVREAEQFAGRLTKLYDDYVAGLATIVLGTLDEVDESELRSRASSKADAVLGIVRVEARRFGWYSANAHDPTPLGTLLIGPLMRDVLRSWWRSIRYRRSVRRTTGSATEELRAFRRTSSRPLVRGVASIVVFWIGNLAVFSGITFVLVQGMRAALRAVDLGGPAVGSFLVVPVVGGLIAAAIIEHLLFGRIRKRRKPTRARRAEGLWQEWARLQAILFLLELAEVRGRQTFRS